MKALIFDTETTGTIDPVVVEAAWVELKSIQPFSLGESFCQRYNPGKPISLGALATHHILDEELVDCPAASSFSLPAGASYLIGHNIDFDWKVIGQPEVMTICTLALSRKIWPELDSHTQSALLYSLDRANAREQLRNAHSASADILICASILRHLNSHLKAKDFEQLWEHSERARVPTHMPFGKHKGVPVHEIPRDYARWLLDQPDIDPYLRKALTL